MLQIRQTEIKDLSTNTKPDELGFSGFQLEAVGGHPGQSTSDAWNISFAKEIASTAGRWTSAWVSFAYRPTDEPKLPRKKGTGLNRDIENIQ